MLKISKFLFTISFILLGILKTAEAADVHLLQLNVEAHKTFQNNISARKITSHINEEGYDFITTQEYEGWLAGGILTNPAWGLSSNYVLVGGPQDSILYYDKSRWTYNNDYTVQPVSPDGGGPRAAVFASFTKTGTSQTIVVATAHLCIDWGKGDCVGGQYNAHIKDAKDVANAIKVRYGANVPVVFTGDFNSFAASDQQNNAIKDALAQYSLLPIGDGSKPFIGHTWNITNGAIPNITIDFVYYSTALQKVAAKLYNYADGNPSDHAGIDSEFNFGDTPPPAACNAPTDAEITKSYTRVSPTAGNVSITVNSSSSSTTGMEIWPWNYQSGVKPMKTSQTDTISFEDKNVSGSSNYTYYVRNVCQGNFSSFKAINVPVQ